MSWFKRKPSPEKLAANALVAELETVRDMRKSALAALVQKLEQIPLEKGIESVGLAFGKGLP